MILAHRSAGAWKKLDEPIKRAELRFADVSGFRHKAKSDAPRRLPGIEAAGFTPQTPFEWVGKPGFPGPSLGLMQNL
jgi:hypothetical protein